MKTKVIYGFLFFLFVKGLFSCSKDKTTEPLPCEANTLFETEIKPVFLNNCTSCHNSNINYASVVLEDYESIAVSYTHLTLPTTPYV